MIAAVLFDLDDTLYPQADFLSLAWDAVADAGAGLGLDRERFRSALGEIAAHGSDRGRIIDRAVERVADGDPGAVDLSPLVAAFGATRPQRLTPYPGAVEAVARVRQLVPVGLVSDGAPAGQRAKIDALGLQDSFDAVVLSDGFGREFRKPHPRPFLAAAAALDVEPADLMMIGDRPDKDVAGALAAGLQVMRVTTGEYSDRPDPLRPDQRAATVADAVTTLLSGLRTRE